LNPSVPLLSKLCSTLALAAQLLVTSSDPAKVIKAILNPKENTFSRMRNLLSSVEISP
jgi:hypothetical protein